MKTHYQLLGISRHASAEQIREAYQQGLDSLATAQHYAADDELKLRLLVLREAHQTLSSPVRRQKYDASLEPQRHRHSQAMPGRALQQGVRWLLFVAILMLVPAAYLRQQRQADPVTGRRAGMPQAGPAQAAAPASGAMPEARLKARRKDQMRRKIQAEALHAQLTQEQMLPLAAQATEEMQQAESWQEADANPARQSMRRVPGRN